MTYHQYLLLVRKLYFCYIFNLLCEAKLAVVIIECHMCICRSVWPICMLSSRKCLCLRWIFVEQLTNAMEICGRPTA